MSGTLFIVATPIGNLGDITSRIAEVLNSCEFVLAEDTRVSIKLLNHLGIRKRLISCHEHNEEDRARMLTEVAQRNGSIALLSDAGTPLISDPGYQIVQRALALNMVVVPVPGPSAFLLALVGSGLPCDRFVFEGFLPDKAGALQERLIELKPETRTIVFYISPHKLVKTLQAILGLFGDRDACLARELTKLHEEFIRAPLTGILRAAETRDLKGEFVLVVAGNPEDSSRRIVSEEIVRLEVCRALDLGKGAKEISQEYAESFGWKRSDVYKIAVEEMQKLSAD